MKDYELAKMSLDELMKPIVQRHLEELAPEQRLAGITPEQLARAFTPEQLAKALTPEQRLAGITPDQLAEWLETLPPELQEQMKRRLH